MISLAPAPPANPPLCPLVEGYVPAGFPSPAADYEQAPLDLNHHLIHNPPATFFMRASGDSMIGAGIHSGDLLIVDRSLEARSNSVVIAVLNGEITVKRLILHRNKVTLVSENDLYPDFMVIGEDDFQIWGVVTHVIHAL